MGKTFYESLSKAAIEVELMINKAKQQQIKKLDPLEELLFLIKEIQVLAVTDKTVPFELVERWNTIYGYIFRVFEGTAIEADIDKITKVLNENSQYRKSDSI